MGLQYAAGNLEGEDGANYGAYPVDPCVTDFATEEGGAEVAGGIEGGTCKGANTENGCGKGEADAEPAEACRGLAASGCAVHGKGEEEGGEDFEADNLAGRGARSGSRGAEFGEFGSFSWEEEHEGSARKGGPNELAGNIGDNEGALVPADGGQADGDGRVYVTAGDIHGGGDNDGEHEAVGQRYANKPDCAA